MVHHVGLQSLNSFRTQNPLVFSEFTFTTFLSTFFFGHLKKVAWKIFIKLNPSGLIGFEISSWSSGEHLGDSTEEKGKEERFGDYLIRKGHIKASLGQVFFLQIKSFSISPQMPASKAKAGLGFVFKGTFLGRFLDWGCIFSGGEKTFLSCLLFSTHVLQHPEVAPKLFVGV